MTCIPYDYGIGTTPGHLVYLKQINIGAPDQVVFRPAATYYPRADFSRVGDGFASCDWVWDTLSFTRLYGIMEFFGGADFVNVYLSTDARDATYPNTMAAFNLYSATMWKPILSGEEGVWVARSSQVIQSVKLRFVNLVRDTTYL